MTVWILRDGKLVEKDNNKFVIARDFPTPMLSPRIEPFESPVTGKEISSWRDRDRDMDAAGAVDPRDIPRRTFEKRRQIVERNVRSESESA